MSRTFDPRLGGRPLRTIWPCLLLLVWPSSTLGAPLSFEGVQLGMSQAEWRAMPPPGPLSPHTKPKCSDDPDTTGLRLTEAERAAGVVVCAYVDVWGKFSLPVTLPLDQKYRLDHVRFWFSGGRLIEIRAAASLNGFDTLIGDFDRLYGHPVKLVRDSIKTDVGSFPRLSETWSPPQGSIELVDPVLPKDEIGLRVAAATRGSAPDSLKAAQP